MLEAIRLRSAAVAGSRVDLERAVPIAKRHIVQACASRAIGRDDVGCGGVFRKALNGSVRQSYPDRALRGRLLVHPLGQVAAWPSCRTGRRQQEDAFSQCERTSVDGQEDILGRLGLESAPELRRLQRVVIARQDDPPDRRMPPHFGERLPSNVRGGRFGIECIAGEQDRCHALLARVLSQSRENGMSSLAQTARQVAGEVAEALAEMKIARMNEAKHDYLRAPDGAAE